MNCPVCGEVMVGRGFGGASVDVCAAGCKGLWFDWLELHKLDEANEGFGAALQEALAYPRINDASRAAIKCPKCGLPMHRHVYESSKEINVDECYACGGFFLDSGELKPIRDRHMSEQERAEYAAKLLANLPAYAREREDMVKARARTAAIDRFTKFLRVSYYMTGR